MKKYFETKLANLKTLIDACQNAIVKAAQDLDIKKIMSLTENLTSLKKEFNDFSKDAVIYLSVDEFIELYKENLVDLSTAVYTFTYSKTITLEEREKLKRVNYQFERAKV